MKKTNYLLLCLTLLLFMSCSGSDEILEDNSPILVEKNLLKMTGEGDHWLHYENGKVVKAWSSSTTIRSQIVYNSNGTMSKGYGEGTGNPNSDNENFEWEIPVSDNYTENIYENGKLKSIMSHNSFGSSSIVEYFYEDDLVVEKRTSNHYFRYIYNNQNELVTIIWDESPSGGSSHTLQVTFDDKVNPYYTIWKGSKLTFPNAQYGLARFNLEFYPHNILSLQEGVNNVWYNAFYTYDEDNYPITMHINEGVFAGDDNYFEYQ